MSLSTLSVFRCSSVAFGFFLAAFFSGPALSLQSLADDELGEVTGQAFVNLVSDSTSTHETTRINFGLDVRTQTNIDKVRIVGNANRGIINGQSADLDIDGLGLGYVDNTTGYINPFAIRNPYLEFAYGKAGTSEEGKLKGLRLGFGEAKGTLTGTINSLTGNVPIKIKGPAEPIYAVANGAQRFLLFVAAVYRGTNVEADAVLVNADGTPNNIRATKVGVPNGQAIRTSDRATLLSAFASQNCNLLGLATCFDLNGYGSFFIGDETISDVGSTPGIEGAAKGLFLSLGHESINWRDLENSGQEVLATDGAFFNVPKTNGKASIVVDFLQALNGVARKDLCYGPATAGC